MYDINKKFIFTHPIKCGGTSIEDALGFLDLRQKYPHIHKFKHASLQEHLEELINKNINVDNFFKFSIIRNPWERSVSFYNHFKYKAYDAWCKRQQANKEMSSYILDARNMSFKEFIFKYGKDDFNSETSTKPFMFFKNKFCLDYVIRLEHLKEDLFLIRDKIHVDLSNTIPHRNNSEIYLERKHYTEYHDNDTKNLIEQLFEWDIKTFQYDYV